VYGYDVVPEDAGYLIRHRIDQADVLHARYIDELSDIAELVEWAARRHQQHN
jgi:hypothetical protein